MTGKHYHRWRIFFGVLYLIIGIAVIAALAWKAELFYRVSKQSFADWPRFVSCVSASLMGFGFLLLSRVRFRGKKPFPWKYVWYYPPILVAGASLVFGVCHIFEGTRTHLFYFIAFPVSFVSGYLADQFWRSVTYIIGRATKS